MGRAAGRGSAVLHRLSIYEVALIGAHVLYVPVIKVGAPQTQIVNVFSGVTRLACRRGRPLTSIRPIRSDLGGSLMSPSPPLSGRVAIVTGANHSIGAATAERLAMLGADVLITYLRNTNLATGDIPPEYGRARARTDRRSPPRSSKPAAGRSRSKPT